MKLVNRDISTPYAFIDEDDNRISDLYETERKYQSKKQHMRIRWHRGKAPVMGWWDERPGRSGRDGWKTIRNKLNGHINKYIGRKFSDCFSSLKHKVAFDKSWNTSPQFFRKSRGGNRNKLWFGWRLRFLDEFDSKRLLPSDYIIDHDGLIQKNPENKRIRKSKDLRVYRGSDEVETTYLVNRQNVYRLRNAIIENWGWKVYLKLISNNSFTAEQYNRDFRKLMFAGSKPALAILEESKNIRACVDFMKHIGFYRRYSNAYTLSDLLFKEQRICCDVYAYGTKEYYIKLAELKANKRALKRLHRHLDHSRYDSTLTSTSTISNRKRKRQKHKDFLKLLLNADGREN